jgi:putative ABC transport system permease protein
MLSDLLIRLRALFRRNYVEGELDDELRFHFEQQVEKLVQSGLPAAEARRRARLTFGGSDQIKEECRDARGISFLESLAQDIRHGLRMLRKSPGFALVAVITLALGIGANTAIFSMVDSLLLRPLPVSNPAQITVIAFRQKQSFLQTQMSVADYRDVRSQTEGIFSELFGYQFGLDGLSVNGKPERILSNYVTGNFFSALGIKPALGRFILPSEGDTIGADPVIVLSYPYWKTHFGGDPSIVGSKVSVDGHPFTVIGVTPDGFFGLFPLANVQAYMPLGMATIDGNPPDFMTDRGFRNLAVFGRLQPGATLAQAQASLAVVSKQLAREYPSDKDINFLAFPELRSRPNPDPSNTIVVISGLFLGLAALVLLLACGNVANILLVRATVREREMAIRAALGAARGRLIRQLLTESVLLALAGGFAGILLGFLGSSALSSVNIQVDLPVRLDFGFDWRVFAYAFSAAFITGIIVGIFPAVRISRGNLSSILHEGGRGLVGGRNRLRGSLVVAQVAGSLMLLIIAGLFTRSLDKAQRTNLGFDSSHVLDLSMDPTEIGYVEVQGRAFYKSLLERVRALPGIESVSLTSSVPLSYYNNADTLNVEGYQPPPSQLNQSAFYSFISPGYFNTLKIPMVRGRIFTDADDEKAKFVAVINETMAKTYWPSSDPIGRQFTLTSDLQHPLEVVGIVKDSRFNGVTGPITPGFYLPFAQHYAPASLETLQVRTAAAPGAMIPEIERIIQSLAPDLPVFDVRTMTQALYSLNGLLVYQLGAALAASLGVLGLILAVVGVYGVVSFDASQKTHEIGIRMALGAHPADILKLIFGKGLFIVGVGLVVGLALAFGAARLAGNFIAVSPTDPITYLAVSSLLVLVALAACYIPARRAMRVDPLVALRYE